MLELGNSMGRTAVKGLSIGSLVVCFLMSGGSAFAADLDLSISSDATATSYTPGASGADYVFTVTNSSATDLTGIVVNGDTFPTDIQSWSWNCAAPAKSTCNTASGSDSIDLTIDLKAGAAATITASSVSYQSSALSDPLNYQVAVSHAPGSGHDDSASTDNSTTDSRSRDSVGDLSITSDGTATTYTPGTTTAVAEKYTFSVSNGGPTDLTNVVIDGDVLSAGIQSLTWNCAADAGSSCSATGISGAIDLTVDLQAGDSASITAIAVYESSAIEDPMIYSVTIAPGADDTDSSPGNDSAVDSRDLLREVDLAVVKGNGTNGLNPQQAFTYTLTLSNAGPSDLGGIGSEKGGFLEDVIDTSQLEGHPSLCADPGNPCWEVCPDDGGTQGAWTVATCPVGTIRGTGDITSTSFESGFKLVAGSSTEARVYVALKSNANNQVTNTATVSLAESTPTIGDTEPNNDSSTDTDSIEVGTNISVSKNDGVVSATPGTLHSYTVIVSNEGFLGVNRVSVSDTLPIFSGSGAGFTAGSSFWQCEAEPGACCNSGTSNCGTSGATAPLTTDKLSAEVDLPAQTSVIFTLTGTIDPVATGTLSNTAAASLPAGITETDTSDNSATDGDTLLSPYADLSIIKTGEPAIANGDSFDLQYVIRVENLGPSFVGDARVLDSFSAAIDATTASWTCAVSGGSAISQCDAASGTGSFDTTLALESGAVATYLLNVSTVDFVTGIVLNTATVSSATVVDPVSSNNTARSAITLTGTADLSITKDDGLTAAIPGEPVTYTVQITNNGPDHVFGAAVQDVLPSQLEKASWTCDASTPIPGDLAHVQTNASVTNLAGASAVITSPDGKNVYAVASQNGTLLAFERETIPNANFGTLVLLEAEQDGIDDASDTGAEVDGLAGAIDLVISPDGRSVYAVGPTDGTLAMFTRSTLEGAADFGRLSFAGAIATQNNATAMAMSPDNRHLYVVAGDVLDVFERDAVNGVLTFLETLAGADIPVGLQDLVLSPDGEQIYLLASGEVAVLDRNADVNSPDFGQLGYVATASHADLTGAAGAAISGDGKHLYVAASDGATGVLVLLLWDSSKDELTYAATYDDLDLTAPAKLYDGSLSGASSVSVTPDGEHVLVVSSIGDSLLAFRRTVATGLLTFQQDMVEGKPALPASPVNGLDGASSVHVTADGQHVLVAAAGDMSVTVFERSAPDPLFSFIELEQWNVNDPADSAGVVTGLLGASAVGVSPDGAHVYAAGLGDHSLSVFARDPGKGITEDTRGMHLDFVEKHVDAQAGVSGMYKPGHILVSPDGETVVVSSTNANSLAVFARETDDTSADYGKLIFIESHFDGIGGDDGLSGAAGMVMDPNSGHLYVAASYEASVGIYKREGAGTLTYAGKVTNGADGVQGLGGAFSLDITASGEHLVVAGSVDDALVVLRRENTFTDPDFGLLSFVQSLKAGVGDRPLSVVYSPEDSHVYVAAYNDDGVSVFRVDDDDTSVSFGKLTIQAQFQEGVSGVSGLRGARALAVSGDGERLYVGGEHDGTVAVFERNKSHTSSAFGALKFLEKRVDGNAGIEGLAGLRSVAISPDSRHLYTAGLSDNALAAFVRGIGSSCTAAGAGNLQDVVDLGVGGVVTYTIVANVRPDALVGMLENTATVTVPPGFTDPVSDAGVNTAKDWDTQLTPVADLSISKTNSRISSVPGDQVSYQIAVRNNGPSNAVSGVPAQVHVEDVLSDKYVPGSISWTCEAIGSGLLNLIETETEGVGPVTGLAGASAVAVATDPDGTGPLGEYVYATGVLDDALVIFERDPAAGELAWVMSIGNNELLDGITVQGLQGARDIAVSADGRYVYVASQVDDAIAVFSVGENGVGGLRLGFLGALKDAGPDQAIPVPNVVDGLNQAVALALSADNRHLYAVGSNDNSVAIFARDELTGLLTFVETQTDGVGLNQGLGGATDVLVSGVSGVAGDGGQVYVVAANSGAVVAFQRDATGGGLSFLEYHDQGNSGFDLSGASAVALSGDGMQLYVTAALSNSISVFTRNNDHLSGSYGTLIPLQQLADDTGTPGLLGAKDLLVSPDGYHVYVTSHTSDAIAFFNRDRFDGALTFMGAISDAVGSIDGLDGVSALAMSFDGRHLYSAASRDNAISVFSRVADSSCPASGFGDISAMVNIAAGGSLLFNLSATVSPDAADAPIYDAEGKRINDWGELKNKATVTAGIDPDSLDPEGTNNISKDTDFIEPAADLAITKTDGLAEYDGLAGATAIAVSGADGGVYLYVAGGGENAIALLQRDADEISPTYGNLTFLGKYRNGEAGMDGLSGIQDVVLSPDGLSLYAAGSIDNAVAVFSVDEVNGQLTFLERLKQDELGVTGLGGPSSVAVSPDGEHVYVAGRNTDSLAIFARQNDDPADPGFGRLRFVMSLQNGVDSIAGMSGPADIVLSPDGKHLYVLGGNDNSVALFARNPNPGSSAYGELTFLTNYRDLDGFGGLVEPASLVLSDDGLFAYAAAPGDDAVVVMARNPADGSLTYIEHWKNANGGVAGLAGAGGVALSPDAVHLYVAGTDDNAVALFSRDTVTGRLAFEEVIKNGDATAVSGESVYGLGGVAALSVTPDNQHLYAVAALDNAITSMDRDTLSGSLGFVETLIDGLGGVAPGDQVDYTIVVDNYGPSDVIGARVVDNFPSEFQSVNWVCNPEGAAGCVPAGTGSVDTLVNIPAGDRIIFTATGMVRSNVTGRLVNTATVQAPSGVSDAKQGNNSATDADTVLTSAADLYLLKDNGLGMVVPGKTVTYSITAGNNGPSYVSGAHITDVVPEAVTDVSWTCVATPEPGLLLHVDTYSGDLDAYVDTVISPDGMFLYAVGPASGIGSVAVYRRDTRAGDLVFVASYSENDPKYPELNGLSGATAVIMSPDGSHLYVAGETDDAIAVFAVDGASGELDFIELQQDGIDTVNGLGGVQGLAMSPDGRHLYAAGYNDDAVAVFSRNSATGKLGFVEALFQGAGGTDGLNGATDLKFSPDGVHLYVAGRENDAVAVLERHAISGSLTYLSSIQNWQILDDVLTQPVSIAMHPQGVYLFVSGFGSDAIGVFERNPDNGALTYLSAVFDGMGGVVSLNGPVGLSISSDGAELYAAASISDALSMLRFDAGTLSQRVVYDTTTVPGLAGVGQFILSADDEHLYAGGENGSTLAAFARQPGSRCSSAGTGSLSDPIDLSVGGQVVYTLSGKLISGALGQLTNTAAVTLGASVQEVEVSNNVASDSDPIVVHADFSVSKTDHLIEVIAGEPLTYQIQARNQGSSDMLEAVVSDPLPIFPDASAGFISGSANMQCAGTMPLALRQQFDAASHPELAGHAWAVASSDGLFVYSTGSQSGKIMVWQRDLASASAGDLMLLQTVGNDDVLGAGTVSGLTGAVGIVLSPNENQLYVVGGDDNSLLVFSRDSITGLLDWSDKYTDGEDGIVGMEGPVSVAVSPDGGFVYVSATLPSSILDSGAIVIFQRDDDTGALTFLDRIRDGFGSIAPDSNVIVDPRQIILSPDGRHVYVNGTSSDAIAMFLRNQASGRLAYAGVVRNGDEHGASVVEGLDLVYSLAMSPNGTHVYATGLADDAVTVFSRDAETGILHFVEVHKDSVNGVTGLDGASALRLSPEGGYLYVTAVNSNSVTVFKRDWSTGMLRYLSTRSNNTAAISDLTEPAGLLVAPDGKTLYVLGRNPGSLVSFDIVAEGICARDTGTGDVMSWVVELADMGAAKLSASATVHPSARGVITNIALAIVPPGAVDPVAANNTGIDNDTRIIAVSDIAISKTGPQTIIPAGTDYEYVLEVTNAGPSDALGATVVDSMPALQGADWSCSATPGSSCKATGSGDLNDTVDVLVGGILTYTITAHSDSGWFDDIANTAYLIKEPGATDPDESNNSDTVTTSFSEIADVNINKYSLQNALTAGEVGEFVLVALNDGPSDARVVRVTDTMPAEFTDVQWHCVPTGGAICPVPATGTGDLAADAMIPAGDSVIFYVEGLLDPLYAENQISNTGEIQLQPVGVDPDLTNDTFVYTVPVQFEADLILWKTDDEDPVRPERPDSALNYALTVENRGPSIAWDVLLSDNWPDVVTHKSEIGCDQALPGAGGVIECALGDMLPGAVKQVYLQGDLPTDAMGIVVNEAWVQSGSLDPYPGNNRASEETTLLIDGVADVMVTKGNGVGVLAPGQETVYHIVVSNIGDALADAVSVNDLMPDELLNVSWTCSATPGATCAAAGVGDITDNIELPVNGVVVYEVTATVDPALDPATGITVENTVKVNAAGEINLTNDVATDSDPLVSPMFSDYFE